MAEAQPLERGADAEGGGNQVAGVLIQATVLDVHLQQAGRTAHHACDLEHAQRCLLDTRIRAAKLRTQREERELRCTARANAERGAGGCHGTPALGCLRDAAPEAPRSRARPSVRARAAERSRGPGADAYSPPPPRPSTARRAGPPRSAWLSCRARPRYPRQAAVRPLRRWTSSGLRQACWHRQRREPAPVHRAAAPRSPHVDCARQAPSSAHRPAHQASHARGPPSPPRTVGAAAANPSPCAGACGAANQTLTARGQRPRAPRVERAAAST
eukprot:4899948-Prymnesium_polylepis.2